MREAARNVALSITALLIVTGGAYYLLRFVLQGGAAPDFSVFWTATHVPTSHLYDSAYVTTKQAWLVPPTAGPRPWIYPPSALLFFMPFGLIAFWPAFFVWSGLSLTSFWFAWRDNLKSWQLVLAMGSPSFVMALTQGQTTLFIGAASAFSLRALGNRPILAGALLGIAAAAKPQLLLMTPIALVSGGHLRSLWAFVLGGVTLVLVSLVFGFVAWIEWARALGDYVGLVKDMNLFPKIITPIGLAGTIGPRSLAIAMVLSPIAGAALTWFAFKNRDHGLRLTALVVGSLCCSPYAIRYELAAIAPVMVATLFSSGVWRWLAAPALIFIPVWIPTPGWAAFLAAPLSLVERYRRKSHRPSEPSETAIL
jgi:alpha-1,2-mannosyltransferase